MKTIVNNPVLRGFNPDPSMVFVDGVYYIATSTFEYYPGVQIHRSTDLVNWELASRPLSNTTLLNLQGNPKSSGVWAPCLSYSDGLFYLVFTDMKTWADAPFKDAYNYITTCETINGDWSEPAYVNSSGFDPSLFHDDDGKKWFVNMEWDHRKDGDDAFSGILIQEWDPINKTLVGDSVKIFTGTKRGLVEGPHIYKKDNYYYLFCAEGGTHVDHAESVSRSKDLFGPYELHPNELLISAQGTDGVIQKAGHGSLCQNDEGAWYFAHLCGRFLDDIDRCPLGRETAIQEVIWQDGWPYLKNGSIVPDEWFNAPVSAHRTQKGCKKYDFLTLDFLSDFQTLRMPFTEDVFSITERPGTLCIRGMESPYSTFRQALLVRRQEDFVFTVETVVEFYPTSFQHMAGLSYRYNEDNQFYCYITYDEILNKRVIQVLELNKKQYKYHEKSVIIKSDEPLTLGVDVKQRYGQFYVIQDGVRESLGEGIDVSILSDEYADPMGFTGAFIGMMATDMKDHKQKAYFSSFKYIGYDSK